MGTACRNSGIGSWRAFSLAGHLRGSGEGAGAIFPVGVTEQHGPHLGTGIDMLLADKLCRVVAARTAVRADFGMIPN